MTKFNQVEKLSEFVSGYFRERDEYKSFTPSFINKPWLIDHPELLSLLSEADRSIGELNAFSALIPDPDLFIKMHAFKEGTASARIEGTQTSIEEALLEKEDLIGQEKKDDWEEVHNYITAMNSAIKELETCPLSTRLFKETHRILLQGVRGTKKLPGEYRTSQNWIGASLKDAVFVPPVHSEIHDLMDDLEKFIHHKHTVPDLIKIGIIHYQFETIHPFLDGNGRIGRLLITLYLVGKKLLNRPVLYLSEFFERHKSLYYDNLMGVRTKSNLVQWLKFFLVGVTETAQNSVQVFKLILELKSRTEIKILGLGKKAPLAQKFLRELYTYPFVDSNKIIELLNITAPTANKLLVDFVNLGILEETTGYKRNRLFIFREYLNLYK